MSGKSIRYPGGDRQILSRPILARPPQRQDFGKQELGFRPGISDRHPPEIAINAARLDSPGQIRIAFSTARSSVVQQSRHLTRPARLEQKRGRVYNRKEGKPCPPKSSTRESVGSSSASQRLPVTVHGRHRRGEMAFRDVGLEDVGCGEKATQDKLEREIRYFSNRFRPRESERGR